MESRIVDRIAGQPLPQILLAAVVQGWALYALHVAIENDHWPATDAAWLFALYSVFVFTPLTVELLAPLGARRAGWLVVGALAALYFYFGWFDGSTAAGVNAVRLTEVERYAALLFEELLLWLLLLPFVQSRVTTGTWVPDYQKLFSTAWRNMLTLAEAALFTGLFWLLLFLWQALFHMLGIDFFRELFRKPIFVYPVTALVFGLALNLIGSLEQWTQVVLEQLLSLLKWLGLMAALILTAFTIALVFKLPTLVFSGKHAIGAAWLLWLVAVVVLLVNAAFRDGSVPRPYPRYIGIATRCVVPLLVIVALTATYALWVRTKEYGLTVERVWAFVVAGCALIYSVGYTVAAVRGGPWMGGIARVNLLTAFVLMAVIAAALTPLLSPYRLAANSQYQMALRFEERTATRILSRDDPFHYLRFHTGKYGEERLRRLASGEDPTISPTIRKYASSALAMTDVWATPVPPDMDARLARLEVYPQGRAIDDDLRRAIKADPSPAQLRLPDTAANETYGLFIDLNGDGVEEFILLSGRYARIYQQVSGEWRAAGHMYGRGEREEYDMAAQLAAGHFSVVPRPWNDLQVGNRHFRFQEEP